MNFWCGRRLSGLGVRTHPCVALRSSVGPTRAQRIERIDVERQRLPVDFDLLDRFEGRELVNRSDGHHGLALIHGLVRQRLLAKGIRLDRLSKIRDRIRRRRNVARQQDRLDARHGFRSADIDVPSARMRQRAQEQPAIEHPFGAVVFGVLRLARDLRHEIRRDVVLSDESAGHYSSPPRHLLVTASSIVKDHSMFADFTSAKNTRGSSCT